jgi:hypothetical protein
MINNSMKTHKHHIIPRHMGGTDDPSNLIELTIEEHAEAHRKLYEEHGRHQDKRAWMGLAKLMTGEEIIREITEEWKAKLRKPKKDKSKYFGNTNAKNLAGKPKSEEHKRKIAEAHTGKVRGEFSEEWKQALKDAQARQPVRTCPHCGLEGKGANMTRYHFDNCKKR